MFPFDSLPIAIKILRALFVNKNNEEFFIHRLKKFEERRNVRKRSEEEEFCHEWIYWNFINSCGLLSHTSKFCCDRLASLLNTVKKKTGVLNSQILISCNGKELFCAISPLLCATTVWQNGSRFFFCLQQKSSNFVCILAAYGVADENEEERVRVLMGIIRKSS